ncbi:MAG: glycosyltransferase family 9 protein [Odoribacter sp.]
MRKIKHIIVRTPNFLGDTINITPCLQLVKQEYPDALITIVCPEFIKDIFKYDNRIARCITFPHSKRNKLSTYWRILKEIKKEKGDLGIIFVNTFISVLLFKLAGIRCNIGYKWEGRGILLDFKLPMNRNKHYINRYADLFNEFVGNKYTYLPDLYLPINGNTTFHFDNPQKTIGLYLGGKNKGYRSYPDTYAIKLIQELVQHHYNIVVIGDENDNIRHQQYVQEANINNCINLSGVTDIEGFFNTISHLDLLITIDSAAMHAAAALKTPFIALLGLSTSPTSTIVPKVSFGHILKIENNLIREEDYIKNITPEIILKTISSIIKPTN